MQKNSIDPVVGLNDEEKVYLLQLARETIATYLESGALPKTQPVSARVNEKFGVFVTLHQKGQLRGCIGYIEGIHPLYEAVMEMARAAAFNDFRFHPVSKEEVPGLEIEISVLSPLKEITDIDEIKVGKHGLIVQRGHSRGLLLPQVATEWNWNRDEFLSQTCQKAGLPPDAWKDSDTIIYIFSAEIFNESDFRKS